MALTAANIDMLVNMLTALAQRQQTLQQLAAQLHSGVFWRSPDGKLAVAVSDQMSAELVEFAKVYLDESEIIIISARAILADKGKDAA